MRIIILPKKRITLGVVILFVMTLAISYYNTNLNRPLIAKDPRTYYMVSTEEKVVAITFDDGPDPLYTGDLLDVLRDKDVKATFFVLGENVEQNPDLLKRISDEGHEIGNHGYSHSYNASTFVKELKRTNDVVFQVIQKNTKFYRPPGGYISESVIEGVKGEEHILTLWSIDSNDWKNPGPQQIAKNIGRNIFPGAIILLHDGGDRREQTIQALNIIIDSLRQEGYDFVTLSELSNFDKNIPVQNDPN